MAADRDFKKEVSQMKLRIQQLWEDPSFPIGPHLFGFPQIKEKQKELLAYCLLEKNVLGILPTGFGKSFVFMALPFFAEKIIQPQLGCPRCVLVISPLKGLIDNQYNYMRLYGLLHCIALHEDSNKLKDALDPTMRVVLSTPEYLTSPQGRRLLASPDFRQRLISIVFDEAHVISDWGSTFRTAYREIANLRVRLQKPVLLLTATCSKQNYQDITKWFSFGSDLHHIALVPNRPNIYLSLEGCNAISMTESLLWLAQELAEKRHDTPKTLVYVKDISQINELKILFATVCGKKMWHPNHPLTIDNAMVQAYYAKAGKATKEAVFSDFYPNEYSKVRIVLCTIAFGLGIDVSDIRRVIHWGAPKNAAAYLQEVGRAGRDNDPCEAYMYVVPSLLRDETGDAEFHTVLRDFCEIKRSKKFFVNKRSRATQTPGHENAEQSMEIPSDAEEESQQCWRHYLLQQVYLPFMEGSLPEVDPCTTITSTCRRYLCCSMCRKACKCDNPAHVRPDEGVSDDEDGLPTHCTTQELDTLPPARLGPLDYPGEPTHSRRTVHSMHDEEGNSSIHLSSGLSQRTLVRPQAHPPAQLGPLDSQHQQTNLSTDPVANMDDDEDDIYFVLTSDVTSEKARSRRAETPGHLESKSQDQPTITKKTGRGRDRGGPRHS